MAVTSLPVQRDLMIYLGADLHQQFRWLSDGLHPQDFTGWNAQMLVGVKGNVATLVLGTHTSGVTLSSDGIIDIRITTTQAAALHPAPNLIYTLDLTDPDGVTTRFMRGRVGITVDLEAP